MNIFKRKKKAVIEDGAIYAITDGKYKGQFVVFVENNSDNYGALAFPEMELHDIPRNDVLDGLKKGIISYVEYLPKDVYSLCCAEYKHRRGLAKLNKEAKAGEEEENNEPID